MVNACEAAGGDGAAALLDLARAGDNAESDGRAEDLEVMIVYLVLRPLLADLIQAVKLIKVHAVAVRHDETVEDNGHAPLLAEAGSSDLFRFAENHCALWDEHMLAVVRIQGIRYQHLYRACGVPIQAIHQNRVKDSTLIDEIGLPRGGIDVCLDRALVTLGSLRLFPCGTRRNESAIHLALICRRHLR